MVLELVQVLAQERRVPVNGHKVEECFEVCSAQNATN